MSVSDLTGTKWTINSTTCTAGYREFNNLYFSINNTDLISGTLYVGYYWDSDEQDYFTRANNVCFTGYSSLGYTAGNVVIDDVLFIDSGTDATNSDLIAWLEANATQIIEPTISDLTGYTWVGNDSLNAPNSYINVNLDFTSNNENYNGIIIYNSLLWSTEGVSYGTNTVYNNDSWTNSAYKTIQITGGTDATNATLIAWLEANGTLTAPQPTPSTTNNIFFGTSTIDKVYFGTSEVSKIYYGNTLIYEVGGDVPDNAILDCNGNVIKASDGYLITTVPYSITCSVTNGSEAGDTYILPNGTATITITPSSNYTLPTSITVSGASYSYNSTTGVISLSNPSDDVSISVVCEVEEANYLTFSSPSSFTLNVVDNQKYWDGTLEYSTDKTTWNVWNGTSAISSASDGTKYNIYLRGSNNTYITGSGATSTKAHWVLTGSNISCDGNIENLLDYQTVALGNHPTMANFCYFYMFYNCTSLTTAPQLSATTLADGCYKNMFEGCTSLINAPELPAATLTNGCYYDMFSGCTSLTSAPTLPATILADHCYTSMFYNCTALTTAPELPATTLATDCYGSMFHGCTSLTTAPTLPATILVNSCYGHMFQGCGALIMAPALPATTLANQCYTQMFQGCIALTTPAIIAGGTTQATANKNCCYRMYYNCTSLNIYTSSSGHTAFYKALTYSTTSGATNYRSSYQMFYKCKINGTQSTDNYLTAGTQYYY